MARPIEVMVSSRNQTRLADGRSLTDLRRETKRRVQEVLTGSTGEVRIRAWINEDSEAAEGSSDWYDESMSRSREAAVVLVLFSGDAGSVPEGRDVGICHAELQAALEDAPTKVRAIDVRGMVAPGVKPKGGVNERFVTAFESLNLMSRRPQGFDEAVADAVDAVKAVVHELALAGLVAARRGNRALGAALDWRRMTFPRRKTAMEDALVAALVRAGGTEAGRASRCVTVSIAEENVLMMANAAPEGLSLASSRELVGQPHRHDYLLAELLADALGPVHVLACPAGATATQMRNLMGATELVLAVTPSGIWAADAVSRGQILALRDCIDSMSVQIQLEAALQWLRQSGEDRELVKRARRRRAIVEQLAAADG